MKFGKYMQKSMVPEWAEFYVDYKNLKNIIKNVALQKLRSEAKFVATLEAEMAKANNFYQKLVAELRERLQRDPSPNNCKEVAVQLIKISQFGFVNENAVRKALKKHDRSSPQKMSPTYLVKLNTESFCPREKFDAVMMLLSDIYDKVTDRMAKVAPKKKYSESLFTRKSVKYWIRLKDVTEVICKIIPHLPIYIFKKDKEKENHSIAAPITSIYFDSNDFYCYRSRLEKHEGATLIRVRWYGANEPPAEVFVERKLHHESWVMDSSTKSRFPLPSAEVLSYFKDPDASRLLPKEKKKKEEQKLLVLEEEKSPDQILADEVKEFSQKHRLQPVLRTQYLRAAFQLPDDNSVRISLDTDLALIRERADWKREWYVPEERLLESDVHNFPYAVLEVKLQGNEEERPQWVSDLMASDLLIPREKFSKFCHGCAVLYPERITLLPYWLEGKAMDEFKSEKLQPVPPHTHDPANLARTANGPSQNHASHLASAPRPRAESAIAIGVDDGPLQALSRCMPCLEQCLPERGKRATTRDRLKIEPKTYFANERTYLQWFNASTLLGSLGLALITMGSGARATGIIMIPLAVALMLYALWQYHRRLRNIQLRRPDGYHDPWGPTILSVVLAIAMVLSGFFSLIAKSTPSSGA